MKHLFFILFVLICNLTTLFSQRAPNIDYPVLFHDVLAQKVFSDSKTFVDCIPLIKAQKIDSCYLIESKIPGFKIADFIDTYFVIPTENCKNINSDTSLSLEDYLISFKNDLLIKPHNLKGSVINLPQPYIASNCMNNDMEYFEGFFTMISLLKSGDIEMAENFVENMAFLIDSFGFIPTANRSYYLSRSQPPVFFLMVEILANNSDKNIWKTYINHIEKEYMFWMKGKELLSDSAQSINRVVLLPDGEILNRYWDSKATPRLESYLSDISFAKNSPLPDSIDYRNLRAANESGWDYSSRWTLEDTNKSFNTIDFLPIELNSLLQKMESTLAIQFRILERKEKSKFYASLAKDRYKAIEKYFWNKEIKFYVDFNHILNTHSQKTSLAGMFPFYLSIAPKSHAESAFEYLEKNFLKPCGLTTSTQNSGYEWDYPYGFAKFQYISISSTINYRFDDLSNKILNNWLANSKTTLNKIDLVSELRNVSKPDNTKPANSIGWINLLLKKESEQ